MILVFPEMIIMIVMALASTICVYINLFLHQKKYGQHVIFAKPTNSEKRLLEQPFAYFLGVTLFVIGYSWFLANYIEGSSQQFLFGLFISLFSVIFGQALGGIFIFLYTIKKPEKISGQIIFKDKQFLALHLQATLMPCLILLISLSIINHSAYILGSLVAVIFMLMKSVVHLIRK